jgi:putative dimethyl sulfoxide reductase chaperone
LEEGEQMTVAKRIPVNSKGKMKDKSAAGKSSVSTLTFSNAIKVMQQRHTIYSFLKRVYEKEITIELLKEIPLKMKPLMKLVDIFPDKKSQDAIRQLTGFSDSITPRNLKEIQVKLAADYARLFLSITKIPPHPSESVYREGAVMQASRDEVMQIYWHHGVDIDARFTEPEDHIAVEFAFMALLCEKAAEELKKGDVKKAAGHIQTQSDFLEQHLLKWVPKLVEDITAAGKTPFYMSLAVLTGDYLAMDVSICSDLLRELDTRRAM